MIGNTWYNFVLSLTEPVEIFNKPKMQRWSKEEHGAAQHHCCVTGISRGPLKGDGIYLRTFFDAKLMSRSSSYSSQWELLSRERRRCCTSFQNFHLGLLPCTPCNVFSYAFTFLVVIPDLSLFMEQEAVQASFTCQLTSLNFVIPHLPATFSVVLKEHPGWNLRRRVRTSHTGWEPATQFSVGKLLWPLLLLSFPQISFSTARGLQIHQQMFSTK